MGNNGKLIVYGNRGRNDAMAAAMGLGNKTQNQKPKVRVFVVSDDPKTTPRTPSTQANVKCNSKNKSFNQTRTKHLTPEEIKENEVKKTFDKLKVILEDYGESYRKIADSLYRVATEIDNPSGRPIVLDIYFSPEDADTSIITISDAEGILSDFIKDKGKSAYKKLKWEIAKKEGAVGDIVLVGDAYKNETIYVEVSGKVEDYARLKWAVLDVLSAVYDKDDELRAFYGV